jgi:hypothetical protein
VSVHLVKFVVYGNVNELLLSQYVYKLLSMLFHRLVLLSPKFGEKGDVTGI